MEVSMQRIAVLLCTIPQIVSGLSNDAGQDKANAMKGAFAVHVRKLTEPEKVCQKQIAEIDTVVNAIESLKLPLQEIMEMYLWLVRPQKDGKPAILMIDLAAIVKGG